MITVIATGGFDPIHSGHIKYLKDAATYGTRLIVGINSDEWLIRKKGKNFMPWYERASIVNGLASVDNVMDFDDSDDTAIDCIRKVKEKFPNDVIVFVNGGDRTKENIPEMIFDDVEFEFGVGGSEKSNSSSWILEEWKHPVTKRKWGTYKVLNNNTTWQVKELSFTKGRSLSDQKHSHRSEHWHVVSGKIKMDLEYPNGDRLTKTYNTGESIDIPVNTWHKATNISNVDAKVIEVWLGNILTEDDIERRD